MPSICVQNLGMYNEGELLFKWVELPIDEDDFAQVLDEIRVCNNYNQYYDDCGNPYEEIMLADWEGFGNYPVSEWSSIKELNEVAEFLDSLTVTEQDVFDYFISEGLSFEDAKYKVERHDYIFIEAEDDTDLAYKYIEDCGGIEYLDRDTLERYFDYEDYGRDLSYGYCPIPFGYIAA